MLRKYWLQRLGVPFTILLVPGTLCVGAYQSIRQDQVDDTLFSAIRRNSLAEVNRALRNGANVHAREPYAVHGNLLFILRQLAHQGQTTSRGSTPFVVASQQYGVEPTILATLWKHDTRVTGAELEEASTNLYRYCMLMQSEHGFHKLGEKVRTSVGDANTIASAKLLWSLINDRPFPEKAARRLQINSERTRVN